jgi:hypothetical protein
MAYRRAKWHLMARWTTEEFQDAIYRHTNRLTEVSIVGPVGSEVVHVTKDGARLAMAPAELSPNELGLSLSSHLKDMRLQKRVRMLNLLLRPVSD